MMIRLPLIVLSGLFCCPMYGATIIVVRHADRDASSTMSSDVPLNAAGEDRAKELASVLRDAKIQAIFTTDLKRTQQTAGPTAQEFHLQPVVIPSKDVDALVHRLKALPEDKTVLVVGQGDTVPTIVERLGGSVSPLGVSEYDRMIVVTTDHAKPTVLTLRYGAPAH